MTYYTLGRGTNFCGNQILQHLFFQRVDDNKQLIGRIIQFSYMNGPKRAREYSSSFVNTLVHLQIGTKLYPLQCQTH